ncbi:hypothetical protein [Streptacidiphilus sp. MAP12-33]|uniref:hypothetical protein n=1 Tax=Streptacidiphilus sp. MAP12-33 TaxID=3156266 RepID=UPI0035129135
MQDADLLAALMGSLAKAPRVYSLCRRDPEADLASHVLEVAKAAEKQWAHDAVKGAVGPSFIDDIATALSPVTSDTALELMVNLSASDLVYPNHDHRDRTHAARAAQRVASLLGPRAEWVSNIEGPWLNGRAWDPVTMFTFDGVIAGRGAGFVVVLLQVGED